jgi:hypothetical protein
MSDRPVLTLSFECYRCLCVVPLPTLCIEFPRHSPSRLDSERRALHESKGNHKDDRNGWVVFGKNSWKSSTIQARWKNGFSHRGRKAK